MKAIIGTIIATLLGSLMLLQAGSGLFFSSEEQPFSTEDFLRAARDNRIITRPAGAVQPTPEPYDLSTELCEPQRWETTPLARFVGRVTHIQDGDTLTAQVQGENITIRLWGIDAPELSQPQGRAARLALSRLALPEAPIIIYAMGADRYGRTLAVIQAKKGGKFAINAEMVLQGLAYHYDLHEARTNRCLAKMQSQARNYPLGLWRDYGPKGGTRPWNYRRATRSQEPTPKTAQPASPSSKPDRFPPLKPPPTLQIAPETEPIPPPRTPLPPRPTPGKSYPQQSL